MSNERIRLDKAIEANANGIKLLDRAYQDFRNQAHAASEKATTAANEIALREAMGDAMKRLQDFYGPNESIYFVIPDIR